MNNAGRGRRKIKEIVIDVRVTACLFPLNRCLEYTYSFNEPASERIAMGVFSVRKGMSVFSLFLFFFLVGLFPSFCLPVYLSIPIYLLIPTNSMHAWRSFPSLGFFGGGGGEEEGGMNEWWTD